MDGLRGCLDLGRQPADAAPSRPNWVTAVQPPARWIWVATKLTGADSRRTEQPRQPPVPVSRQQPTDGVTIPQSFLSLTLETFYFDGNPGLSLPDDPELLAWLDDIGDLRAPTQDPAGDRGALVALYNATDGANWANNENWLSDEPLSTWYGVTVSDGRVTGLDLEGNQLTGSIPPALGNLSNLRWLYLDSNELTGQIPDALGNLAKLERLDLGSNGLTGPVPLSLGRLSNLTGLWLGGNELTGQIPDVLGNLSNLRWLHLDSNELTGQIPDALGNLAKLEWLDLGSNGRWVPETRTHEGGLTGTIPDVLGNLSNLTGLWLGGNELTGQIPDVLQLGQARMAKSLQQPTDGIHPTRARQPVQPQVAVS